MSIRRENYIYNPSDVNLDICYSFLISFFEAEQKQKQTHVTLSWEQFAFPLQKIILNTPVFTIVSEHLVRQVLMPHLYIIRSPECNEDKNITNLPPE
jgi:hypothetical protein